MTKDLQYRIWALQPVGMNPWMVQPMNIHDEVKNQCLPSMVAPTRKIVEDFIVDMQPTIPLVKMEWKENLTSWADKGKKKK